MNVFLIILGIAAIITGIVLAIVTAYHIFSPLVNSIPKWSVTPNGLNGNRLRAGSLFIGA